MRLGVAIFVLLCLLEPHLAAQTDAPVTEKSPHELYDQLNGVRVDPSTVYQIRGDNRIELRRGDIQLTFEDGNLAFLTPFEGRITGLAFSGRGHALSAPRGVMEKQQMALFTGSPVLDEDFISAYIRFTDDTADEILQQIHKANLSPQTNLSIVSRWDSLIPQLNPPHSLRILFGMLSQDPKPFLYAALNGVTRGPFDVLIDQQREEQFVLGQPRVVKDRGYYDVWASYKMPNVTVPVTAFHVSQYDIEASILPDTTVAATATIHIRAETGKERVIGMQFSRALNVESVTDEQGKALTYFQNEGMSVQERSVRGNDLLYVVFPSVPAKGETVLVRVGYRGHVIEDAGNGVFFVGARESWYPHFGDNADYADYNLTMKWPRKLRLVATGTKLDESEEGDFRIGHWRSERPATVAGFNLGEYAVASIASGDRSVDIYANHQLEQAVSSRIGDVSGEPPPSIPFPPIVPRTERNALPAMPPSPAADLKQLAKEIDSSIHFFETLSGPFPYRHLSVSQIPGTFGQGWPGLLYVSTYSFLRSDAQSRAGLSPAGQEHFTEIVPFHEVAHQWWGNLVGWSSYRDQWIDEAIANYLAILFAESRKDPDHTLHIWLERYRQRLLAKGSGESLPAGDIGALILGSRLISSKSPEGFDEVIYAKGTWVIHMLREMLRQPKAKNPDARFTALLQTLTKKYANRAISTEDLQLEVEKVMTPAMDLEGGRSMEWFFEEWVRGTGIPHYRIEFTSQHTEKGVVVKGKLFQTGVPESFIAPVPIYASMEGKANVFLGTVDAAGSETSFHFITQGTPRKLQIDPQKTILCSVE